MELAVHPVDDNLLCIMLACLNGCMKSSICVPVRIKPEERDMVYEVLVTNDVCVHVIGSANDLDKQALEYATEKNGCYAVTPAIFLAALRALDPKCSLSCEDLMAMAKPMPDIFYYDFRDGVGGSFVNYDDDGGDSESDDGTVSGDDESDDGNHSDGDDEIRYYADLDEPMLPHNGHCGNCMGQLVKVKATEGRYLLSRKRCVRCGQGA
jgi:hypothetical protein